MIQTNSAFDAANSSLQKQPTFVTVISGYKKVFASRPGLSANGIAIQTGSHPVDFGGLELFPSVVSLTGKVTKGDPIILLLYYNGTFGSPEVISSITDTGSHTWTSIYSYYGHLSAWSTIANADYPSGLDISVNASHIGFLSGGNFEIFAVEIPASYAGFAAAGAQGTGSTASVTAGSTTISFPVNAGSFWNIIGF